MSSSKLLYRLFGINPAETRVRRRGFEASDAAALARIETIGAAFVQGYHAALQEPNLDRLARRLDEIDIELSGFAYEGAGMGLAVVDFVLPWRRGWQQFLDGPAAGHVYMLHVGAGWAWVRLPLRPEAARRRLHPLYGWLALDGYGFHQGYFDWRRYIELQKLPANLSGYSRRAFDQGLGRALWFVKGADPANVAMAAAHFPPERRNDLWSGIGLAASYAGGASQEKLELLPQLAGEYTAQLAQGAAFAAKARQRAGNPAPHTKLACRLFCGLSADDAAKITDNALIGLPADDAELPAYEHWRRIVQNRFARSAMQK